MPRFLVLDGLHNYWGEQMFNEDRVRGLITVIISTALALTVALGCGDDSNTDDSKKDGGVTAADQTVPTTAPKVSFKDLKAYSVAKGTTKLTAKVEGTATKLELLVDGKVAVTLDKAPWEFSWDTSKATDGLAKLTIKGYAGTKSATSDAVTVVVLNNGEVAKWKFGNSAKIIVPKSGYVNQHLRYAYDMSAGVSQIINVLSWDKPGFELELAIGVGLCPDSGTTAVKKQSKTSPVVIAYPEKVTGKLGTGQWFAHVELMNPTDTAISGKETPFKVETYMLK